MHEHEPKTIDETLRSVKAPEKAPPPTFKNAIYDEPQPIDRTFQTSVWNPDVLDAPDSKGAGQAQTQIAGPSGSMTSRPPGSKVSGVIATGTIAVAPSATLIAYTRWGDDISPDWHSSVTLGNGEFNVPFSVEWTYSSTGCWCSPEKLATGAVVAQLPLRS